MALCAQCGQHKPLGLGGVFWDNWYCSTECLHAAGDHHEACACTPYRKKRRAVRHHRAEMRIMMEFIGELGLLDEYEERVLDDTGNNCIFLGYIPGLDDGSDVEDPDDPDVAAAAVVADTAAAAADQQALVAAVGCIVERHGLELEVERLRMQLEDAHGAMARQATK